MTEGERKIDGRLDRRGGLTGQVEREARHDPQRVGRLNSASQRHVERHRDPAPSGGGRIERRAERRVPHPHLQRHGLARRRAREVTRAAVKPAGNDERSCASDLDEVAAVRLVEKSRDQRTARLHQVAAAHIINPVRAEVGKIHRAAGGHVHVQSGAGVRHGTGAIAHDDTIEASLRRLHIAEHEARARGSGDGRAIEQPLVTKRRGAGRGHVQRHGAARVARQKGGRLRNQNRREDRRLVGDDHRSIRRRREDRGDF